MIFMPKSYRIENDNIYHDLWRCISKRYRFAFINKSMTLEHAWIFPRKFKNAELFRKYFIWVQTFLNMTRFCCVTSDLFFETVSHGFFCCVSCYRTHVIHRKSKQNSYEQLSRDASLSLLARKNVLFVFVFDFFKNQIRRQSAWAVKISKNLAWQQRRTCSKLKMDACQKRKMMKFTFSYCDLRLSHFRSKTNYICLQLVQPDWIVWTWCLWRSAVPPTDETIALAPGQRGWPLLRNLWAVLWILTFFLIVLLTFLALHNFSRSSKYFFFISMEWTFANWECWSLFSIKNTK